MQITGMTVEKTISTQNNAATAQLQQRQLVVMLLAMLSVTTLVVFLTLFTNPILTIAAGMAAAMIIPTLVINHIVKAAN